MTRLQEMSLDYHFGVEQEVGSSTYSSLDSMVILMVPDLKKIRF